MKSLSYSLSLLGYDPPDVQIHRLQFVHNAAARAVTTSFNFIIIAPILKPLHWLNINQCIEYEVLSLTYKHFILVALLIFIIFLVLDVTVLALLLSSYSIVPLSIHAFKLLAGLFIKRLFSCGTHFHLS